MTAGLACVTLPLLASCDEVSGVAPPPSPSVTSMPPPASNTPSPDPAHVAAAGAIAGFRHWDATIFQMRASGGTKTSMLASTATGIQLDIDRAHAKQLRLRGVRAIHNATILSVKASRFSAVDSRGVIGEVTLTACIDVTRALAVDKSGKSVVAKGRLPRLIDTARMRLVGTTWKAAFITNKGARTC